MGRFLILLLCLTGFALLFNLVPGCSPSQHADELQGKAEAALLAQDIPATVVMSGNVMRLRGELPDDTTRAEAVSLAESVRCEGCEDRFHEVVDETTVAQVELAPVADPYTFNARYAEDGTVTLNGVVPSEAVRTRVLAEAERHFPGNVVDDTVRIARGAPNDLWGEAISLNLNELHLLERGRLSMNNTDVVLSGRAASEAVRDEINALAENEPEGYNQVLNIEVIGSGVANVGQLDNEALCQELLNDLNQQNEIQFDTDSARLRPGRPIEVLGTLAGGMNQCPGFNVKVEGHASHSGGEQYNMDLSRDRAAAVVTYLTQEGGVSTDRLTSEGFGESRPKVETNDPTSDLAVNRRIEFIVSR